MIKHAEIEKGTPRVLSNTSPQTRELLQILRASDVQLVLDAFRQISALKRLSDIPAYPSAELRTIRRMLKKIWESGWMDKNEHESLSLDIGMRIEGCKGSISRNNNYIKELIRNGKRGAPKKFALDILCFSLVYMLRQKTTKPHYDLVGGFLLEQGITNKDSDSTEYIRKKRSKQEIESILQALQYLGSIRNDDERLTTKEEQESGISVSEYFSPGKFVLLVECLKNYKGKKITQAKRQPRRNALDTYPRYISTKIPTRILKDYSLGKGIEFNKKK